MNPRANYSLVIGLLLSLALSPFAEAEVPTFAYETTIDGYYLGSARGTVVDGDGNAYTIASWYEDQQHLDILVFKLDPDGTPLWTVPIVGDELEHDIASDIALDSAGDVWITGRTSSDSFPIVNGLDDSLTGFTDAFIMKLDSEDGTILYSTFLGGDYVDHGQGIFLNDADEIYVVGSTGSTDFPTTEDAYQSEPSAPLYIYTDAFITKLSAAGDEILYSTYFGGFEDDAAERVALDGMGNIVLVGQTTADDFPLVDPIQSDPNDIFISKLSADGSTLLFSTYFGGEDLNWVRDMVLDQDNMIYLTGSTRSINFPTTAGAFQEDFVGGIDACGAPPFEPLHNCEDGFVTKLGTSGEGLVFSTYLGGSSVDDCNAITLDSEGHPHVVGYTSSADFPGLDGPAGSIFVTKLSEDGTELIYTFAKQSGSHGGHGITIDDFDDVYFSGSVNVPADIYVAKIRSGSASVPLPGALDVRAVVHLDAAPNPFTASTQFRFSVPGAEGAPAQLTVYDASGRVVRTLLNASVASGPHTVAWDGSNEAGDRVPAGVYLYELRWNGESQSRRVLFLR